MSWTKITCFFAFCALLAAPVLAQPSLDITQTGLNPSGERTFGVFVTPDPAFFGVDTNSDTTLDASAMAIEIAISSTNPKGGTVPTYIGTQDVTNDFLDDNVAPLGNTGDNPFTGTVTTGIVVEANNTDMFAALGSTGDLVNFPNLGLLSERTLVFSFTINDDVGVFDVTGAVAQGDDGAGVVTELTNVLFGVAGDFDLDGDVDDGDFGVFSNRYAMGTADPQGTGDFDLNGLVNDSDFGVFSSNYNRSVPTPGAVSAVSVPEPSSLLMVGLGLAAAFGIARRR